MEYAKNGQPLKLTWDDVVKQFENLVKYAAKQQVLNYGVDNMLSAEDLYQEGMIKLYDCWEIWCLGHNKDLDEFGAIFRTSLYRCVQRVSPKNKHLFVDIEDNTNVLKYDAEDTVEKLHIEEGLELLANNLSDVARDLLHELIEPSTRTLYEVWADIERKKMLKSQGKKVNIPKDNTVRMKHIIRSLEITPKQYDNAMAEIREKANELLKSS